MEKAGDKMVTNAGYQSANRSKTRRSKRHKKQGPFLKLKAGSAMVPIYRNESGKRVRCTLSFYREGRRVRKMFSDLDEARKVALFVSQRIQVGMQHVTDLKPHQRDSFKTAEALLQKLGMARRAGKRGVITGGVDVVDPMPLFWKGRSGKGKFGSCTEEPSLPEVSPESLELVGGWLASCDSMRALKPKPTNSNDSGDTSLRRSARCNARFAREVGTMKRGHSGC